MKSSTLLLIATLISGNTAQARQDDPNEANLKQLAANAATFVKAYNEAKPAALAELFLPEGEIILADGSMVTGREQIRDFYAEVLSGETTPQAALEAGSVRFVGPGIAIEDGTLHVTKPSGEVTSHYYTAVQVKQEDGNWLTASIRDEIEDHAPASEKLIALDWMIGDWMLENNGSRSYLSFSWSDDGPYIDGRILTEQAGEESTASTYRIGWNSNRKNFVSWAFDALGGYTKSDWTDTGDDWLLRTNGVTADGEVNQSIQTLLPGLSNQSFEWSTRDQIIGGEAIPNRSVRVVKRPPAPSSATISEP